MPDLQGTIFIRQLIFPSSRSFHYKRESGASNIIMTRKKVNRWFLTGKKIYLEILQSNMHKNVHACYWISDINWHVSQVWLLLNTNCLKFSKHRGQKWVPGLDILMLVNSIAVVRFLHPLQAIILKVIFWKRNHLLLWPSKKYVYEQF